MPTQERKVSELELELKDFIYIIRRAERLEYQTGLRVEIGLAKGLTKFFEVLVDGVNIMGGPLTSGEVDALFQGMEWGVNRLEEDRRNR